MLIPLQLIDVIVDQVIPVDIVKLVRYELFYFSISSTFFLFLRKAIVTSCERTPCVHGQCFKIDLYTEICVCKKNWTGIDCSQTLSGEIEIFLY
jgi:hypothetical protein